MAQQHREEREIGFEAFEDPESRAVQLDNNSCGAQSPKAVEHYIVAVPAKSKVRALPILAAPSARLEEVLIVSLPQLVRERRRARR